MPRYIVRHLAVREDEGFDLLPRESILSAEYDCPYFHLIILIPSELEDE